MTRDVAMGLAPWGEWRPLVSHLVGCGLRADVHDVLPMILLLGEQEEEVQDVMMHYAHGVTGWQWYVWADLCHATRRDLRRLDWIMRQDDGRYNECVDLLGGLMGVSFDDVVDGANELLRAERRPTLKRIGLHLHREDPRRWARQFDGMLETARGHALQARGRRVSIAESVCITIERNGESIPVQAIDVDLGRVVRVDDDADRVSVATGGLVEVMAVDQRGTTCNALIDASSVEPGVPVYDVATRTMCGWFTHVDEGGTFHIYRREVA